MCGYTLVRSIQDVTAPQSSKEMTRKADARDRRSKEPQRKEIKKSKSNHCAQWGRGHLTRTLLCLCLLPCCYADGVGYPHHEDVGKPRLIDHGDHCTLDATHHQPIGLPNSLPSRRDDAMANVSLVGGCGAASLGQLGTFTYFLNEQEVLASRLHSSSLALLSYGLAVPDATCLVGLPTRCQFPHSPDLRMQDVGIPMSWFLNAFTTTWVGDLLVLLSILVVLGWGLFFLCLRVPGRKRNRKRSKKKLKPVSRVKLPKPLFRELHICSECRWVGGGKGRKRRLKSLRAAYRDKRWAFANKKLSAWVQGKGASEVQARALAACPRRKQVNQGQLWACRRDVECRHPSTQEPASSEEPQWKKGHELTRARKARRTRRSLSFKCVLALAAVLLCRDQLAVAAAVGKPLDLCATHLAEQGVGCTLAARKLGVWDPRTGQRIGEASNPGPEPDKEMQLASALLAVLQSFKEQVDQRSVHTAMQDQRKDPASKTFEATERATASRSVAC